MSFQDSLHRDALKAYTPRNTRKRYLVSEGELFQLYKEVMQVRQTEERQAFHKRFKQLMKDAQEVSLTPKIKSHD